MTEEPRSGVDSSASSLLEAVVHAEMALRALENTCISLEEVISLGRATLETADDAPTPRGTREAAPDVPEAPAGPEAPKAAEPPRTKAVPEEEPVASKGSLEEQAAALRAAMAAEVPAARPAPAAAETNAAGRPTEPSGRPKDQDPDRRPFQPKRTSPLKSRLARDGDESPAPVGETFSDRSAELEQLLRREDSPAP